MKITYIAMQFPSSSETFLSSDLRALKRIGVDPYVISMKPPLKFKKRLSIEQGVEEIPSLTPSVKDYLFCALLLLTKDLKLFKSLLLGLIHNRKAGLREQAKLLLLFPSAYFALKKIVSINPDLVHFFWGHYPSLLALLLATHTKIPYTMFLGAYDLEKCLPISKIAALNAKSVFTHAHANLPKLVSLGVPTAKIKIVHRGVDIRFFSSIASSVLRYSERENCIVCAGRMIPSKRFDTVIDIFNKAVMKGFHGNLYLFGDGPDRCRLVSISKKLGLENRVFFQGFVKQYELYDKFCKSSWFILLSNKKGERLPNVVKEAMLAGCSVICSDTPGISELIAHGEDGYIFNSEEIDEIVETLVTSNSSKLNSLSENARAKINNSFEVEDKMREYFEVWQSIQESLNESF